RRHTRSKRDWSSDVCSSDLGEQVPDIAGSAVAVVGEDLDQYRDPAWGVPLVQDRLERRPFGPASPALNRTLDVVVGHPGFAPVEIGRASCRERLSGSGGEGE